MLNIPRFHDTWQTLSPRSVHRVCHLPCAKTGAGGLYLFLHNLRQNPKKPLIKTNQTSFASNQGAMFLEGMEYSHPPQRYSVHRTCRCVSHTKPCSSTLGKNRGYPSREDLWSVTQKILENFMCHLSKVKKQTSYLPSGERSCFFSETHLSTKQEMFEQRGWDGLKKWPETLG